MRSRNKQGVYFFLLASLLLNNVLPSFVTWSLYANFAQTTYGDATLICTGSDMKWISLSAFEQSGLMVEVEKPVTVDDTPPCPLFVFDEYHNETLVASGHGVLVLKNTVHHLELASYLANLKSRFEPLIVRGPPAKFLS